MNDRQELEDRFMQFCDKHGYAYHGVYLLDEPDQNHERYALRLGLQKSAPPPDLGVHIQDGIGSKDKVGG